jgi:hypothetical protein
VSKDRANYLVPLLAAAIGLAGGLLGAHFGAEATITTQREQAHEARRSEARVKRAKVYSDFLAAADSFESKSRYFTYTIHRRVSKGGSVRAACRRAKICGLPRALFDAYSSARSNFQGALNQVYVYGTPRGVRAARELAGGLPPALYKPGSFSIGDVDEPVFFRGYNAVLDTMCAEVSADPRPTC